MNYHLICSITHKHTTSPLAIATWCEQCLGEQGVRWQMRTTFGKKAVHLVIVEFLNEKDMMLFAMVWTSRVKMHDQTNNLGPGPNPMIPMYRWGEQPDE